MTILMTRFETENFTIDIWDDGKRGYFEHNEEGEYWSGGLWFEDGVLIDYDGVCELPREVIEALEAQGYIVEDEFK